MSLLQSGFRVAPHPELVAEWAALGETDSPLERVKRMQRLVEVNPAAADAHIALAEAAAPLRSGAASILELEGKPAPSPKEALARVAAQVPGAWGEVLAHISAAREGKPLPSGAAPASLRKLPALAGATNVLPTAITQAEAPACGASPCSSTGTPIKLSER